jgi:hypothetical protein
MKIVALEAEHNEQPTTPRYVALREISGTEEMSDLTPSELVARLIVDGTVAADELNLSEQDLILAEIYRAIYGDEIECFTVCASCEREFEVSFALDDWIASLRDVEGPVAIRKTDGVYEVAADNEHGVLQFRLPTVATLRSVAGWDARETATALRQACIVAGDPEDARLEAAMARAGPLLDDELETECAYCGAGQAVAFRIADFLLATLRRERAIASREVHHLAHAYHWSRDEIVRMPRSARREHVRLVLAEAGGSESSWG